MIGVRLNSFNDNSGEPEQDANSALTELDKGLRSGKVGEQCEAIVRFPRLFEKYPFPILINSSFLKLADVFRMGNNFLRLWVLRVCQQSEKHLDKILNVDEFLRRIYSVLHSNDSVARALALRTLGAVAGIIPERQNVHHAIRRGLDSHDNVEVEAAIYATTRFAAHSNAFAMAMCNKLSDMVECESTGPERRAKLVRALRTVHGGAVRAQGVLQLLRSLLERFPSSSSVRAAITALTAIANDTVVHVPDTVELLLSIATQDARSAVRKAAVLGLKTLASHAALWSPASIEQLVRAAQDSQDNEHTMLCLQVMQILVQSGCVLSADGARAALRTHCAADALSAAPSRAARACAVLAGITLHCYEENQPVEGDHLMLALEALVIATGADGGTQHIRPLRVALKCLVQLSKVSPADYAARTCATLYRELCGSHLHRSRVTSLLEALAALGGSPTAAGQQSPAVLFTKLCDTILDYEDGTALVLLCTVVFQERAARALTHRLHAGWQGALLDVVQKADGWTRYRVARAALRYGHHSLAATVLSALRAEAPTETIQRWLAALATAAAADARLTSEGIASIPEVQQAWELACGLAREGGGACGAACGGCGACVPSAPALLRARACALAALAAAADAAHVLCSQPPPAVAQSARTPGARGGACEGAARAAARRAGDVSRLYQHVASTAFLADDTTLRLLYISQHTFAQLASFLERVVNQPEPTELSPTPTPMSLEEVIALAPSREIARIESKLFDNPTTGPGITHRHAEAILACVRALCTGSVWARAASGPAAAPLCRLALSPAGGKLPDHALPVPRDHRLALRLEGVLRLGNKKKMQREVKAVQITVTATPHPRTNEKTVELTGIPPVLTAVQTVTPVRDFFSAQQLVSVNTPGLYTVAVEAAFVDQHGELWKTGPRASIVIKANDDPSAKGNNTSSRSRF